MTQWTKNWWAFALRAALAIVCGIIALVWPGVALAAIVTLFGLYAMADGVFATVAAVRGLKSSERWGALLFEGFVGIGAGAAALFWPGIGALALTYLVAGWALLTGMLEIAAAVRLRKLITGEWLLIIGGLLSILFAVVVVAYPGSGMVLLAWWFGAYALSYGVVSAVLALRVRRWAEHHPALAAA